MIDILMGIGDINYRDGYMKLFPNECLCIFLKKYSFLIKKKEESKINDVYLF
jgi:hypothetical protein